jgi:hypothetical protein
VRKGKDPEPDLYIWLIDPDSEGPISHGYWTYRYNFTCVSLTASSLNQIPAVRTVEELSHVSPLNSLRMEARRNKKICQNI